jgi:hypothetical protein
MSAVQRGDEGASRDAPAETDATGDSGDGDACLDVGTACEVLGNRRRRYALHYLKQQDDGAAEMGDISTRVAAWEHGIEPEAVSYDERKTVHTSLYQHHAPKLAETGLVEYDSRSGRVELTEAGAEVDLYLEAVAGREVPWSSYFLGLSGAATLASLAAWQGAVPGPIPEAACGVAVAVAFLVSSLVFVYDNRRAMRLGSDGPPPEVGGQ